MITQQVQRAEAKKSINCLICQELVYNKDYYLYCCNPCNFYTAFCFPCNRAIDVLLHSKMFMCYLCKRLGRIVNRETVYNTTQSIHPVLEQVFTDPNDGLSLGVHSNLETIPLDSHTNKRYDHDLDDLENIIFESGKKKVKPPLCNSSEMDEAMKKLKFLEKKSERGKINFSMTLNSLDYAVKRTYKTGFVDFRDCFKFNNFSKFLYPIQSRNNLPNFQNFQNFRDLPSHHGDVLSTSKILNSKFEIY
jgi:hypothetical protein